MELGPYDNVQPGTVLFTLVDPHQGHEVAYNLSLIHISEPTRPY